MVLFVNGCVRENSRTLDLAKAVLAKENQEIQEVRLYADGPEGLTPETLRLRDELSQKREFTHPCFDGRFSFPRRIPLSLQHPIGI